MPRQRDWSAALAMYLRPERLWKQEPHLTNLPAILAICALTACTAPGADRTDKSGSAQEFTAKGLPPDAAGDRDHLGQGAPERAPPERLRLVGREAFADGSDGADGADGAAVILDFESFADGESLAGRKFRGMQIVAGPADPLVVPAADTRLVNAFKVHRSDAYKLVPPRGAMVLSPGGAELPMGPRPAFEDDDLTLVFDPPVSAVGFTVLSPSADGMSFTEVNIYSPTGELLFKGQVDMARAELARGGEFPGPGSAFWGCATAEPIIARVVIDEQDSNDVCPDANIGFSEILFCPAPGVRAAGALN